MKTLFTALIALFVYVGSIQTSAAQEKQSPKKTSIRVQNLHCDGDMPTIKNELLKKDGVMDVIFTDRKMGSSIFTIKYLEQVTNRVAIENYIEGTPGCDDKSTKTYRVTKEKGKKEVK